MAWRQDLRAFGGLLGRFLWPYWRSVAAVVALHVVVGFMLTIRPLLLAPALDSFAATRAEPAGRLGDLTLNNVGPTLAWLLGLDPADAVATGLYVSALFLAVTGVVAGLGLLSQALLSWARGAVFRDLVVALHAHVLSWPLAYFHKRRAGELVARLTQDAGTVAGALDSVTRGVLQSLAQLAVALAVLFRTDALFSLTVLAMGSVHFAITRVFAARVRRLAQAVSDRQADVGASLFESLAAIRTVKSFAAERYESRRIREAAERHRRYAWRARLVGESGTPVRLVADALVLGVLLVFAFRAVGQGRLTVQAAALFFYLAQQLLAPIAELFRQWLVLAQVLGGATRVLEILATRSPVPDGTRPAAPLRDAIVLERVSFAYEAGRPVLTGIDLEIRRGERVAIVGPSGAGKSTLADLILRLFDPQEGAIRYDGTEIQEFQQASYRRHFGVVAQDALLFNATVRENIVYHRAEDPERLAYALWAANAEEFVRELPAGLDTVLGDRGVRLSGGQRQRIAIARAVYGGPSVLVLDEATSNLDSQAEREVQQALDRIGRDVTLIVIAHRLSTVIHADRIVVLNRGRVEAQGPHAAILEASPTYRRLYDLQFAAPAG